MSEVENFTRMVSASKKLQEKWNAVYPQIQADIKDRFGVDIDEEAVKTIQQARLVTLSNSDLDETEYTAQIERLPELAESLLVQKINAGDEESRQKALAEVTSISSRSARLSRARELGIETAPAAPDGSGKTREEKLALLAGIASPSARLSQARAWGVC